MDSFKVEFTWSWHQRLFEQNFLELCHGHSNNLEIAGFGILNEMMDSFEELIGNSTFEAFLLTGQYY